MQRLRVLHLCGSSGNNTYLRSWADHGDRQRFDFRFATLEPEGATQQDLRARGLPCFSLNARTRAEKARAIVTLRSYLRSERIDILQTHLLDAAWVGGVAARLAGTPLVVFTGHHSHEVSVVPSWRLRLADAVAAGALSHRIMAHSLDMREIFIRYERIKPERMAIIPFPLEREAWTADPARRHATRVSLGLADRIVLGAAGRLYWVKDFPLMLRAFAELALTDPRLVLVIAGQGSQGPALEGLVRDLGIGEQVRLVGHRTDMPALFSAFDLFVHTALAESFCQVVVEAFALGVPVVASDVGISPEIVTNDVNGRLFRRGDQAGLTAALRSMLAERDRWPAMGEEGRRRIEPFAAARVIPRYEAQYLAWFEELAGAARGVRQPAGRT